MLGAARRCLDMSVEYAKVREQFGQPIGSFQAIKHTLRRDAPGGRERARRGVLRGLGARRRAPRTRRWPPRSAKAYVSDAARKVCGEAIQVHGGIGFTWEYDLHLYFKRAKHLEPLYGDADFIAS